MSLFLYALRAAGQVYEVRACNLRAAAAQVAQAAGVLAPHITERDGVAVLRDDFGNRLLDVEQVSVTQVPVWVLFDEHQVELTSESREAAEDTAARLLAARYGRSATYYRNGVTTIFTAPVGARLTLVEPS